MYNKWVELRNGDTVYFIRNSGEGSVVKTESHGRYFMPAKIGMRIKGIKNPIMKFEKFIFTNSRVQKSEGCERIVKCYLTRIEDSTIFAISERQLHKYFGKSNESSLG
jgi:hypothetical protein